MKINADLEQFAARPATDPVLGTLASAYLDMLRAGAANWVVIAHLMLLYKVSWLPYQDGGVAVVVFFLLSGFLITQSMLKRLATPAPRFPSFLADRVARIMTPYVPALIAVAIIDALFIHAQLAEEGISRGPVAFLGNLFMLQNYPFFQLFDAAGISLPWRIRPYNSAEPFWTVAIEMWIYVAVGAIFFLTFTGERLRRRWLWPLLLLSVPVLVWNAAAGGGKSLSLIWLVGAIAGVGLPRLAKLSIATRRYFATFMFCVGLVALAGHARKFGFQAYELQTACLLALLVFAPFIFLQTVKAEARGVVVVSGLLASYSYSLYLIHNTAIALVWSVVGGVPSPWAVLLSVGLAHVMGILLYRWCERHYKRVGYWLRPRFEAALSRGRGPVPGRAPAPAKL